MAERIEFRFGAAIDPGEVDTLRRRVGSFILAPALLALDCRRVRHIEPVGAALLRLFCLDLEQQRGTRVVLTGLPYPLAHRMRLHPLSAYLHPEEDIFRDPFAVPGPSLR